MTDEEALTLKPGDVVRTRFPARIGKRVIEAKVARVRSSHDCVIVELQRTGKGGKTPLPRWPWDVEFVRKADPVTANVFADWLEEQGEVTAAALLRAAFPMT